MSAARHPKSQRLDAGPGTPGPGEVHVWTLPLECGDEASARYLRVLADDERRRARRLLAGPVRSRWVAARAAIRAVLGGYAGIDADRLVFVDTGNGKPGLEPGRGGAALCFNLSHSGSYALLAVTRSADVGVDIEQVRRMEDAEQIAKRFFASSERATLDALPRERRETAFFECWTRKEALLKATGEGIGFALREVAVSFGDDQPPRILGAGGRLGDAAGWSLHALAVPAGHVGALAVRDPGPVTIVYCHRDPHV